MGTPAVGYNVPGLRDSIKDQVTGVLTKDNTPRGLADSAINLLKQSEILNKLSLNALNFSKQFNWKKTTQAFEKVIQDVQI